MKSVFCLKAGLSIFSAAGNAADEYSVGFGVGVRYSGLGLSFARITDTSMGYLSVGCLGWSSNSLAQESNCGFSVGYLSRFSFSNPNISLGVNFNVSNNRFDGQIDGSLSEVDDLEYRYGVGLNYHFNGIGAKGLIAGISAYAHDANGRSEPRLGISLGYHW